MSDLVVLGVMALIGYVVVVRPLLGLDGHLDKWADTRRRLIRAPWHAKSRKR